MIYVAQERFDQLSQQAIAQNATRLPVLIDGDKVTSDARCEGIWGYVTMQRVEQNGQFKMVPQDFAVI